MTAVIIVFAYAEPYRQKPLLLRYVSVQAKVLLFNYLLHLI